MISSYRFGHFVRNRLAPVLVFAAMACTPPLTATAAPSTVAQLLQKKGLANAYYACLLNGIAQRLPLKQIQDDCAILLSFNGAKPGGGNSTDVSPSRHRREPLNPAGITAVCGTANSGRAQNPSAENPSPLGHGSIETTGPMATWSTSTYTWGGKGQPIGYAVDKYGQTGVAYYKGLSEQEAKREKQAAMDAWKKAYDELTKLKDKQTAELSAQGKQADKWKTDPQMKKERDEAQKKVDDAFEKVDGDPNVGFGGIARTAQSSECEQALQAAREFIVECQRTEWRSIECKRLLAGLNCPDPTLIYVDPEIGYTCRPRIDRQALQQAAVERCHLLKRPTVDGADPCTPPKVDSNSRYISGDRFSPCGGPQALTTGEPDERCIHIVNLPRFGERSAQSLYVWGLNHLGGPVVVIFGPRDANLPSGPGPSPRPGDPDGGNPRP